VAFGVGQDGDAQAVFLAQHRIGVDVDLVEANASSRQPGRQLLAEMAAAPAVEDERLNPCQ